MAMFIRVDIDSTVQADEALCRQLVDMCPVDIFRRGADGGIETIDEHLDECTLCDLCVRASAGRIEVVKLYRQ